MTRSPNNEVDLIALLTDLREGRATVEEATTAIRQALREQFPALAPVLPHVMFAVNAEYADDQSVIPPGAAIACIPPVSGG